MKALLAWYSFTGQTQRAVEIAARRLRDAGYEVTQCRVDFTDASLRLKRPMSIADVKRWTKAAEQGEIFDVVLDPPQALDARYDFVAIFSNTWQMHPASPIRSLLALPAFKSVLLDTRFAVYVICRRLWERNAQIVRAEAEAAGGSCVGVERFDHHGGPVSSLIRTVSYLLSSGGTIAKLGSLRLPLPPFGLSNKSIARVSTFTQLMIEKLKQQQP